MGHTYSTQFDVNKKSWIWLWVQNFKRHWEQWRRHSEGRVFPGTPCPEKKIIYNSLNFLFVYLFKKNRNTLKQNQEYPQFLCQTNFELKSRKKKCKREREWKSETGKKLKVTFDNSLSLRWITHETSTFTMFTYL